MQSAPFLLATLVRCTNALDGGAPADQAWRDYLALDSTSDWAREARARLAQ